MLDTVSCARELPVYLQTRRAIRRSKRATVTTRAAAPSSTLSVCEQPVEAADRAVPGHGDGDLIGGATNTHVATLVERRARLTMRVKVRGGRQDRRARAPTTGR